MTLHEVEEAAKLIQDSSHEDANIIFGAVIDDEVTSGDLRVTVIATGLDDGRIGRSRDERSELGNVRPLRREAEGGRAPAQAPASAELEAPLETVAYVEEEPPAARGERFDSPFADEFDVPAFLRKKPGRGDEGDRELPAFLRRSAD
jgi:cell division protein FtsZ